MLHIALPVLDDLEGVIQLLDDLKGQTTPYQLWICVNQPESWTQKARSLTYKKIGLSRQSRARKKELKGLRPFDPGALIAYTKRSDQLAERAKRNQSLLTALKRWDLPQVHILDHSSPGYGWPPGKGGIGWARKVLIDAIMAVAPPSDWIISIDADTRVSGNYLAAVAQLRETKWRAAVIPYWHRESNNPETTRAGALYEIYLRIYRLQLMHAGAQFHVTPLGSAFAVEVGVCQKISGLTPKPAGEDFYFLQKIAKYTPIKDGIDTVVYPQMRLSDRVIFGTGPAIADIEAGRLADYPLYPNALWQDVRDTISAFPLLWDKTIDTPMSEWLQTQLKTKDLWTPLRQTFKTQERFINACHQRVDALRIFQYLRQHWASWKGEPRVTLREALPESTLAMINPKGHDRVPSEMGMAELRALRLALFDCEQRAC